MKRYTENLLFLILIYIVLCMVAVLFTANFLTALLLSLLSLYPVYKTFAKFNDSKVKQKSRDQLKSLLENISTKLSSGNGLENSFFSSYDNLSNLYGENSYVCVGLKMMKSKYDNGYAFSDCIHYLTQNLNCPESYCIFETISKTRHLGSSTLPIINQNLTMLSEIILVSKDISGDVSQKRLESMIMAVMPVVTILGFGMGPYSYAQSALSNPLGKVIYAISYVVCILGFCLGLSIVSNSVYKKIDSSDKFSDITITTYIQILYYKLSDKCNFFNKSIIAIIDFLPIEYKLSIKRKLSYLNPKRRKVLEVHIGSKLIILFTFLLIAIISKSVFNLPLYLSFGLILAIEIAHDIDINSKIESRKIILMADLPGFVSLLCTLLSNGFVLQSALFMCIETFSNSNKILKNELSQMSAQIHSGTTANDALMKFSSVCEISEISAALNLAGQFSKSGNEQSLNLLKIQTGNCFLQSKIFARKNLDRSSVKLLIPMILHLICVILISITPAVLSFQGI